MAGLLGRIGSAVRRGVDEVTLGTMQANKPYAQIKGFVGGPGFRQARTWAKDAGMDVLAGAKGKSWGGYALGAGAAGLAGGGAGALAADRGDRWGGAAGGASLGVLGHGAYRFGRGAWSSGKLRGGLNTLGNRADGMWGRMKSGAAMRRETRIAGEGYEAASASQVAMGEAY